MTPSNPDFYHWRGHYYHDLKLYRQGMADFSGALQLRPDFPACYADRAHGHWHYSEFAEELADANESIRMNPANPYAFFEQGQAYFGLKDYSNAVQSYTRAIELDGKYVPAYRGRAQAKQALGDTQGALADKKVLATLGSPTSATAGSTAATASHGTAVEAAATTLDFSVADLQGRSLRVGDFRGKVLLIEFWATWCGPCMAELPNLLRVYQRHHAAGLEIIGISLDKDLNKLRQVIAEKQIGWAQHTDGKAWDNDLARRFGIHGIPANFLLDRDSRIIQRNLRGATLEKAVGELLGPR